MNCDCGFQPKSSKKFIKRRFAGKLLEYLDRGHGACVLRDPEIRKVVSDSLTCFHSERVDTGDFVVMPNHVHVLLRPYPEYELEDILFSIKSYTANRINRMLKRSGELWMRESYDHIVRDGEELLRIQAYIRSNPEKAKLAENEYSLRESEYAL